MRELMRVSTHLTIALVLALAALSITPVTAQRGSVRVAVVIGNGAYKNAKPLPNPPKDAKDMAAALEKLGFKVYPNYKYNVSKADMVRLGEDAKRWFAGSDVGLFFYAGHGLQINNENFIVPVDSSFANTSDISTELFSMSEILSWMNGQASANLIFLDACRKNPFTEVINAEANEGGTVTIGDATLVNNVGQGLAEMNAGAGTLIAYAAQPGKIADDGQGSNSPFTKGILSHIRERGKAISDILISVRNSVLAETQQRQTTWDHSSLTTPFYFIAPMRARDVPIPPR
jgi:uncharacterized caspase-like protein